MSSPGQMLGFQLQLLKKKTDRLKTTVEAAGLIERNDVSQEKTLKNSKSKSKGVNKSALTSVEAGKNRNEENNSAQEKSRQNPKSVNNASTTQEKTGYNSKSKNNDEKDSNSKEMEAVKRSSRTTKKSNVEEETGKTKEVEIARRSSRRRRSIDGHKKKASASRK